MRCPAYSCLVDYGSADDERVMCRTSILVAASTVLNDGYEVITLACLSSTQCKHSSLLNGAEKSVCMVVRIHCTHAVAHSSIMHTVLPRYDSISMIMMHLMEGCDTQYR